MTIEKDRHHLEAIYKIAIAAAHPDSVLPKYLPNAPNGKTIVVGAGKACAQMAQVLERNWTGALSGTIVTRYGFSVPCEHIDIIEAAHPVPDEAGLLGAQKLFEEVQRLESDDLVIALISGGGSALLPSPIAPLTLEDEISLNETLLASGAPIGVMNTIRKQISQIKGGRLAAAVAPAAMHTILISDIPGDVPGQIASGPTIADDSGRSDALKLIEQYDIKISERMQSFLNTALEDAPKPDDPRLASHTYSVIASSGISLRACAKHAQSIGLEPMILSESIEGEASEAGLFHAAIARQISQRDEPTQKPAMILSGGETTVTIRGKGKGGRNTEFLLSFAIAIAGLEGVTALAADTDGIDGSEDNAGAFCDGTTVQRMKAAGIDPILSLQENDAWSAFDAIGDIFKPGPSGTNVNDLRAIIIR